MKLPLRFLLLSLVAGVTGSGRIHAAITPVTPNICLLYTSDAADE